MSKMNILVPGRKEISGVASKLSKSDQAKLSQKLTRDDEGWTGKDGAFFEEGTDISKILDSLQVEIVGFKNLSQSPKSHYTQDLNTSRRTGF